MIAMVLVAHSVELATGLRRMLAQASPSVPVRIAAGMDGSRLGTSALAVEKALRSALGDAGGDDVLVLLDLGSGAMAIEVAIETLPPGDRARVRVSGAPFVEGAILASVAAAAGASIDGVLAAAAGSSAMPKLPDDWPR